MKFVSELNTFIAAFWPAWSPSNVKMTSPFIASAVMSRWMSRPWSSPKAVPHEATAVSTPAMWQAMTSV